jgi:hypothetical protein
MAQGADLSKKVSLGLASALTGCSCLNCSSLAHGIDCELIVAYESRGLAQRSACIDAIQWLTAVSGVVPRHETP